MRKYYPKSFLRLILLGFALVALPLILAFGISFVAVDRLAKQSAIAVQRSAAVARHGKQIGETLTGMERLLRQYLVLQDAALLDDYRSLRIEFDQTLEAYEPFLSTMGQHNHRLAVAAEEKHLNDMLNGNAIIDPPAVLQAFTRLVQNADDLVVDVRNGVDNEVAEMLGSAQTMRERLVWLVPVIIPIALLIAIWFRAIISAQLSQINTAIGDLGRGDYRRPIEVRGPTDLATLGQRLDWLRRRLSDLEQQKSRFLRHVSHDLKTPLTAIREGTQLLDDGVPGPLTEQQRNVVGIMRQNSLRLQSLIEQMLNFQRASQAAAQLDLEPLALDKVCDNVVADHLLAAASRGVRFQRLLRPVQVEGDSNKLRVVIDNLVANALKYSPREGVVRVLLGSDSGDAVVDVIDQGPGVAENERNRIFEPFFRGTHGEGSQVEGSGLGLAIAKEYVAAHHGRIDLVDSNSGAHFRVVIPTKWKEVGHEI